MEPQCQAFISLLGADKISLPGSTGYNASLLSYFFPHASAVEPLCFVLPKTVQDVSAIVESLVANSCEFAVRGGGHMWFPRASISPGGVTIDLRGLNAVDPSLGGLSYYSPQYDWTCNQAKAFEVVLADVSVVRATGQENADLCKRLRGGGNNFGIVTRVELVTFEQGDNWATLTFNPTTVLDQQAAIYARLMMAEDYDENASFLMGWVFSARGTIALNQLFYTAPTRGTETPSYYRDVIASYGEESVAELKTLRVRVDLHEGFTRLVPGGFKLPVCM